MFARHCLSVLAAGLALAGPAAAAPTVETMVVGRTGTLLGARAVSASATAVSLGARSCAVDGATPLAALLALTRLDRTTLGLHDYGRCGSAPADSAALFVSAVAGQANRGQDGWEYKVGQRSGTTGAADPSGALGNGALLRTGQRVLWFWCVASVGGCQRTLGVSVSDRVGRARAGGALTVSVTGYDNDGHGAAVAGATVRFGSSSTLTGSGGRATLAVPTRPGRYALSAAKGRLVPSFPTMITVR